MGNGMEKRLLKRRHLVFYLEVVNRANMTPLGWVADLSEEGLMLVAKDRLRTGAHYEIGIRLPEDLAFEEKLIFARIQIQWAKRDKNPDYSCMGCRFVNLEAHGPEIIACVIETFAFEDSRAVHLNAIKER